MPMTCLACRKRPAQIHVTETRPDGKVIEAHLCSACVGDLDLDQAPPSVAMLLAMAKVASNEPEESTACSQCGHTFRQYKQMNLVGCALCWSELAKDFAPLIQAFHGTDRQISLTATPAAKVPTEEARRVTLERELAQAVNEERYEDAARLRDCLRGTVHE